jgi:hypothetical protein
MKSKTNALTTISERALLVDLSISCLGTSRKDAKITRDTIERHGMKEGTGRFTKDIIDPKALDPLKKIIRAAGSEHKELTLPWANDGSRIVAAQGLSAYKEKMKVHERAYWDILLKDIKPNFPKMVAEAKANLNGGFDITQYPDYKLLDLSNPAKPRWHNSSATNQFDKKFGFAVQVSPVPTGDDFRCEMDTKTIAGLQKDYEAFAAERIQGALGSVWARLHDTVEHMLERLKSYGKPITDEDGNPTGKNSFFLDTLVSNVSDVLDLVPLLNITGDPAINKIATQMRAGLTEHSPETLRRNEFARNDTANRAEEILSKMSAFMA